MPAYALLRQPNAGNLQTVLGRLPLALHSMTVGIGLTGRVPQEPFYRIA